MPGKTIIHNSDYQQLQLPLDLGAGEHVLKRARLVAQSIRSAWYELYLIESANGYLIEKHSGATGCGRQKETWFRRQLKDAEQKYMKILTDKINPARRSPRKYIIESDFSLAA